MQWGSWICSQAVIEGLTALALDCTGGKLKQPEMMGRVLIKTCLSLPLHSWAQRNGSVPRSTSKGAPRGCLTSGCPQPGGGKAAWVGSAMIVENWYMALTCTRGGGEVCLSVKGGVSGKALCTLL